MPAEATIRNIVCAEELTKPHAQTSRQKHNKLLLPARGSGFEGGPIKPPPDARELHLIRHTQTASLNSQHREVTSELFVGFNAEKKACLYCLSLHTSSSDPINPESFKEAPWCNSLDQCHSLGALSAILFKP
eukprot:768111-Hanusia_phi.AAC.2